MLRKIIVSLILTVGLVAAPATLSAASAETASPVIDNANLFDDNQEQAIVDSFTAERESSGLIFAVETVDTINGQNLQNYTINRANELGVGDADKDNGVFMLIVKNDRLFQIEPGVGVSSVVSAPTIQSVVDQIATPAFRANDYVGGVIDSAAEITNNYIAPMQPSDANNMDISVAGMWVLIILGGALVIGIVIVVSIAIVKSANAMKARRADALDAARYHTEQETIQKMRMDTSFKEAQNREERYEIIRESLSEYLKKDPGFEKMGVKEIHDTTTRLFLTGQIEKAKLSRWSVEVAVSDMDNYSINNYFDTAEFKAALEDARKVEAEKKRVAQEQERQRAKVAAEKERQRKQTEKDAKTLWRKMPSSAKKQVLTARSRAEKRRIVEQYNSTGMDMNALFPVLFALYAADTSSSSSASAYSGSSHSSSSSSSSSSYSSYDSGSSFSGGSFDGGGGGGSW